MSNKNDQNQENDIEDEMEKEFLKCDEQIIEKLIPNEKLANFEIDIKEIMKSGCNRQIAEYALMKYNIQKLLEKQNAKYIESKNDIKNEINNKLGTKFENLIKDENIKDEEVVFDLLYEEIIDEIIEEIIQKHPENVIDLNIIKKRLIKLLENENINFENFKKVKELYIQQREPIIEAALRLVKKIVNNKEEYDKFHDEYYKNEDIVPFINVNDK